MEFIKVFPDKYQGLFKVGRSAASSDFVWTNPNDISKCITSDLASLDISKNDLVIIALGYLSRGLIDSKLGELNLEEINKSMEITGIVSSIAVIQIVKLLSLAGGGDIVVFSSVAASPVLKANLFYGASKNFLEKIVEGLKSDAKKNNVQISIICPGFVETKLNKNRKKTSFSTTTNEVAKMIVHKFPKEKIYIPSVFQIIELGLKISKILRFIANKKIIKSYD
jgi:short-subunit dehydrogenase